MQTHIVLFRGINVGGNNKLPMKRLCEFFDKAGVDKVISYINSGNIVFCTSAKKANDICKQVISDIINEFGFEPAIQILELKDIENAIAGNPFPKAESAPETLHIGFLSVKPKTVDYNKLNALTSNNEEYVHKDTFFYLFAPEGVGRSKLAAKSEKILGVSLTDRNWRTVCKLRDLALDLINK